MRILIVIMSILCFLAIIIFLLSSFGWIFGYYSFPWRQLLVMLIVILATVYQKARIKN